MFDFATGLGQALIVARRAVDFYSRYGVEFQDDPEFGRCPDENAAYHWTETERLAAEAEARLPRVQIVLGPARTGAASKAVRELTQVARLLEDYVGAGLADRDEPQLLFEAKNGVRAAELAKDEFLAVAAKYALSPRARSDAPPTPIPTAGWRRTGGSRFPGTSGTGGAGS